VGCGDESISANASLNCLSDIPLAASLSPFDSASASSSVDDEASRVRFLDMPE
jgi:hypothetical protein